MYQVLLIVGSCLLCLWPRVTETSMDEDVMLLLRVKQQCLCFRDYECCLHYVLCLMKFSVVLQLNTWKCMLDSGLFMFDVMPI